MNVFKLPCIICNKLSAMERKIDGGIGGSNKCMNWVSWEKCAMQKIEGIWVLGEIIQFS